MAWERTSLGSTVMITDLLLQLQVKRPTPYKSVLSNSYQIIFNWTEDLIRTLDCARET